MFQGSMYGKTHCKTEWLQNIKIITSLHYFNLSFLVQWAQNFKDTQVNSIVNFSWEFVLTYFYICFLVLSFWVLMSRFLLFTPVFPLSPLWTSEFPIFHPISYMRSFLLFPALFCVFLFFLLFRHVFMFFPCLPPLWKIWEICKYKIDSLYNHLKDTYHTGVFCQKLIIPGSQSRWSAPHWTLKPKNWHWKTKIYCHFLIYIKHVAVTVLLTFGCALELLWQGGSPSGNIWQSRPHTDM